MSPEGETACSENAFVVDVVAVTAPEVPGEDERETPVAIVNHATNSQKGLGLSLWTASFMKSAFHAMILHLLFQNEITRPHIALICLRYS